MTSKIPLLAITEIFPHATCPHEGAFIKTLIDQFSLLEVSPIVVTPRSIFKPHSFTSISQYPCLNPPYLSLSRKKIWRWSTFQLSNFAFYYAARLAIKKLNCKFVACYAHFLFPSGYSISHIAKQMKCPSILSLGESSFFGYEKSFSNSIIHNLLHTFNAIVTVSPQIHSYICEKYHVPEQRVHLIPNAVNTQIFHPIDKRQCRALLNLPENDFIIIFVGHFNTRKGSSRLLEAVKNLPDIKLVFIGNEESGSKHLESDQILFKGIVAHDKLPYYLNAADIFVLPTSAEGCSNALLEAMACGLPIITSDIPANHAILSQDMALFIDPLDIENLRATIILLKNNPDLRTIMSHSILKHVSTSFNIRQRAMRILEIINNAHIFQTNT
jgi:teichuronic acid biosynthesis glycosyltransferase TuaC